MTTVTTTRGGQGGPAGPTADGDRYGPDGDGDDGRPRSGCRVGGVGRTLR